MRRMAGFVLILSLACPHLALAGKPKKDKKKVGEASVTVVLGSEERERVRVYLVEKHGRGNCPPGLAKKKNGCLPPGQAKKRYVVGHPLPSGIVVEDLAPELSVRIGRAPAGYRYAMIDGDLVKLVVGTMLVVNAIEGLVE